MDIIAGAIGGGQETPPEVEPDPDEPEDAPSLDDMFNSDFDLEEEPEGLPEEPESTEADLNQIITNVAGTYYENLQNGIEENLKANESATEEEKQAAREEYVAKEAEAFAGLLNIAAKPEETTEEELVKSVDAVLKSDVCLGTVTDSVETNTELTDTVKEATGNMTEESKTQIQEKIESALAANPEKEEQFKNLADLFNITLGSGVVIPDDVVIPDGILG